MEYLTNVHTEEELNRVFRRYAMKLHPDVGGKNEWMQQLNQEYSLMKRFLGRVSRSLSEVVVGDTVVVNGTECEVTHVSEYSFVVKAKAKYRTGIFDKKTGFSVTDQRFRAFLV